MYLLTEFPTWITHLGRGGRVMKHILQVLVNLVEWGPVQRLPPPAAHHELIHAARTVVGRVHAEAGLEEVVDAGEFHARVRRLAVRGDLPQQHAEGPHVRLGAELVVGEALGRRPLDRELGAHVGRVLARVALAPLDEARQTEVGHLDQLVLAHEAVARGQVPVGCKKSFKYL